MTRLRRRRTSGGSRIDPSMIEPVSWSLPEEGQAIGLVANDYVTAARTIEVEPAAVRAVGTVESGGRSGFDGKLPKIRYENHYFQRLTGHRFDVSHPHLSAGYKSRQYNATHGRGSSQWRLLREAFTIAPRAAVQSVSWGMFQVMGTAYQEVGWTDLEQFVKDMFYSEAMHLRAFLGFCTANGLVQHLRSHNWAAFARGYNGPRYRDNAYDVKIGNAYIRYSRS